MAKPFTVGILAYKREHSIRHLLASIKASKLQPTETIIIDNGGEYKDTPDGITLIKPGWNTGVARSFNMLRALCPHDDLILCNDDVQLGPETLGALVDADPKHGLVFLQDPTTLFAGGYTCFNWRSMGYQLLGGFDEAFYPAYYEDVDMTRRMVVSGLPGHLFGLVQAAISHVKHETREYWYKALVIANRERYISKWGGYEGEETYTQPWNLIGLDLRDVPR